MSERLTEWARKLTAQERRELGAFANVTGTYLAHCLVHIPQTVRVSTAFATMEYAKELGVTLTIEDFTHGHEG